MDNRAKHQNAATKTAQKYFPDANRANGAPKDAYVNQHAAAVAKIARLRTLRLAKEAEDKVEADRRAAQEPSVNSSRQRKTRQPAKRVKGIRRSY